MARSPCFSRVTFTAFRSQSPVSCPRRHLCALGATGFLAVLDFTLACGLVTRHRPNRIHLHCGPTIHLQMLSTPPRGDAVSFGYRPEGTDLAGTCTPRMTRLCRRTSPGKPGLRDFDGRRVHGRPCC